MEREKNKITIEQLAGGRWLPLFSEWGAEESRAYLALDCRDGAVYTIERAPHETGMTQAEAHGHVRLFRIPNNLTADGLNKLLADRVLRNFLRDIFWGAKEKYENGRFVTVLDDEAREAEIEARDFCEKIEPGDYGALDPWDAQMYLSPCAYGELVKEGESHSEAAQRIAREALDRGVFLVTRNVELTLDKMKRDRTDQE